MLLISNQSLSLSLTHTHIIYIYILCILVSVYVCVSGIGGIQYVYKIFLRFYVSTVIIIILSTLQH